MAGRTRKRHPRDFCHGLLRIGKTSGPQPVPATVDYDLWCGPAPLEAPRRTQFHYDWHWFWETGNGDIGNQGAHHVDLARMFLDQPAPAESILSIGGRFGYDDDGQTPNTLLAVHDYDPALLICEVRGLPAKLGEKKSDQYRGVDVGNVIECENGYICITAKSAAAFDQAGKPIQTFDNQKVNAESAHKANFIAAVRTRNRADQLGELQEGHASSSITRLSNISFQLGRQTDPDIISAALTNPAAAKTLDRLRAHLDANGIDLKKTQAKFGMPLRNYISSSRFPENPAADALLTRAYRKPFVVPEAV